MLANIGDLEALFATLGIDCPKLTHPPLHTCDDAEILLVERPGTRLKNLFLRDNYGRRHFLLIARPDAQIDLKALSKQQGLSRLGFASDDRLARYLGVRPGCVSMLALANDDKGEVELWLDERIWHRELFHCHPFDNRHTWLLTKEQLLTFFAATGHTPEVITLPLRT